MEEPLLANETTNHVSIQAQQGDVVALQATESDGESVEEPLLANETVQPQKTSSIG